MLSQDWMHLPFSGWFSVPFSSLTAGHRRRTGMIALCGWCLKIKAKGYL
jgi:hypothetical protein